MDSCTPAGSSGYLSDGLNCVAIGGLYHWLEPLIDWTLFDRLDTHAKKCDRCKMVSHYIYIRCLAWQPKKIEMFYLSDF